MRHHINFLASIARFPRHTLALASVAAMMTLGVISPLPGCTRSSSHAVSSSAVTPMNPDGPTDAKPGAPRLGADGLPLQIATAVDGVPIVGTAQAVITDTRLFPQQIQKLGPKSPVKTPVRNFLPDHPKKTPEPIGPENDLKHDGPLGEGMLDEPRTMPLRLFPSDVSSGWNPPDPTLAVGPDHVVVTVNQHIAFYNKATGAETFEAPLNSTGNPGFFEPLGAGTFCFDPRCAYDHFSGRFIVMVLETYGTTEAWIDIAISDDSDPNGIWYKYRTDAVLNVNGVTVWWDFPGLGFDQNSIYITSNLFGLSASGGYGGAVRIFDKAPLLTGQTAVYSTLASTVYTTQPAVHVTQPANNVGLLVHNPNSTQLRIYGITGPAATATIQNVTINVPNRPGGPGTAPNKLGNATQPLNTGGWTTPYVANDRMVVAYNAGTTAGIGGVNRSVVHWYEINLNGWPTSGSTPTLRQSGVCDPGPGTYSLYPAAVTNASGDIGLVMGVTRADKFAGVAIAGRRASDPLGKMGQVTEVFTGSASATGRWGDYFAAVIDPSDASTFWGIGEYNTPSGWENWITSFLVTANSLSQPLPDEITVPMQAGVTGPQTIDVLANDWHSTNATLTISTFDATSSRGGTVTRSVGTGPGGRDRLVYTPPASGPSAEGRDVFNYSVTDGAGNTASAAVVATVFDPANYRTPANPSVFRAGVQGTWYNHPAGATALADYAALPPVGFGLLTQINQASTSGTLFGSGRTDTAAVFEGYIDAPTQDIYTLFIESDDGSRLSIGNTVLIDNDGNHGMLERSAFIGLKPGRHAFRIEYYDGGGAGGLILRWQNSTIAKQVIPAARLSSVRPCPTNLVAAPGTDGRSTLLTWTPPQGVDPPSVLLRRNGVAIATLSPTANTFTDTPPLPAQRRHIVADYTLEATGASAPTCVVAAQRVPISSGTVRFAENFDTFADTAALTAAGWQSLRSGNAVETADWTMTTTKAAPASVDGARSRGRFVISDSDAATGTNPTGGGASHDLISPAFDCSGLTSVFLHFDVSAQLNNNGTAIFDVDVSSDQNPAWTNVLRRVAPGRTLAPASTVNNADGVYGRLSVPLGAAAAGRTGVRVRFRHFEPTDDWFIAIDNVLVDNVNTAAGGAFTLMPTETFTAGIPGSWSISSLLTGTQTWTTSDPCLRGVPSVAGATPTRNGGQAVSRLGTRFAMVDSSCFTSLVHDDRLITPTINCANAGAVYLTFKSECLLNDAQTAEVLVSLDGGLTYLPTPVFSYSRGALNDSAEDPFYMERTLHVPEAAGQTNVKFAFRFANVAAASWWAIDDVRVTIDQACPADIASQNQVTLPDGVLTADDIIVFLGWYFSSDLRADVAGPNQGTTPDQTLSADDIIVFLGRYFAGC